MSTWKTRLSRRLKSPSRRMHPFPCSALLACFGNTRDNASFDQPSTADTHPTTYAQPMAKAGRHPSHLSGEEGTPEKRRDSGTHSERAGSADQNASNHTAVQTAENPEDLPGSLGGEVPSRTSIPRPSIIEMPAMACDKLQATQK
ncbi:Sodium/Potassium/Calcium Exchanger 5 [Manis pentadactyla]|nr:Sodium/Potassium/Calcium Exchanger 5 [Manis pentadactyla]